MASINKRPGGHYCIQFVMPDGVRKTKAGDSAAVRGTRKTIRFGKITKKTAGEYCKQIESILQSLRAGVPIESETAQWLAKLPPATRDKLKRAGLVNDHDGGLALGAFLDRYIASRPDVKASTATVYGHTARCLKSFFTPEKPITAITLADADAWRTWLATKGNVRDADRDGLSENTIRRRCSIAKQFFRNAVRSNLLKDNPFRELRGQTRENAAREYFLTRADFYRIIEACPDAEWRLIVALTRMGGLRCPSELFAMKWEDVNLAEGRFVVRASKTEHHASGGIRHVPVFPELRPFLEDAQDVAKPGSVFVIAKHRLAGANLRTRFQKIIIRAGLTPWPKLFQNLRSSRQTELLDSTELGNSKSIKSICKWFGNSPAVAMRHYAQALEAHSKAAASTPTGEIPEAYKSTRKRGGKALHQATQTIREDERTPAPPASRELRDKGRSQNATEDQGKVFVENSKKVGDAGLEPATCTL